MPHPSGAEVDAPDDRGDRGDRGGGRGTSRLAGELSRRFHKLDDCFALLLDRIKALFCDQNLRRLQKTGLLEV